MQPSIPARTTSAARTLRVACIASLAGAPFGAAQWSAADTGPLLSHDIPSVVSYPQLGSERAYSVGGVWCNASSAPLAWSAIGVEHPVTATNLLRVAEGRLVHIGASWAYHHGCPLQSNACGTCVPEPGGCAPSLGAGCSTTSTAGALGTQSTLAPRSQIDASAVAFPFPFQAPPASGTLARRCRVDLAQLDPGTYGSGHFAFHTLTLHPAATEPTDGLGGSAVRSIQSEALTQSGLAVFAGPALPVATAIDFWRSVHDDVWVADLPIDGLVRVGMRVVPLGDAYRYEMAIENLNSHESIQALVVPLRGASATDPFFACPLPHSGEVTSGADWPVAIGPEIAWATTPFEKDPLANAIRWGTVYSFGFTSSRPPAPGWIVVTGFRGGAEFPLAIPTPAALGDIDFDGVVGPIDLAQLLGAWGPCAGCGPDLDGDGAVGASDLAILLGDWSR